MSKIFVRERRNVSEGEGRPRWEIVAVSGLDLKVYHSHVRKSELERLAEELSATLVYLPAGEGSGPGGGGGQKRRKKKHDDEDDQRPADDD
jgi:hypothetical protein